MWQLAKETKTTVVNIAQKSENIVWKLVVPKPRNRSCKIFRQKIILCSRGKNVWPVFTEKMLEVDRNNKKNWQVQKINEFSLKQIN